MRHVTVNVLAPLLWIVGALMCYRGYMPWGIYIWVVLLHFSIDVTFRAKDPRV